MTIDDDIMLRYDEQSLEYQQAKYRIEVKKEIVKLLRKIKDRWASIYPNDFLSMSVSKGYLTAFSLDFSKKYLMNETEVHDERYEELTNLASACIARAAEAESRGDTNMQIFWSNASEGFKIKAAKLLKTEEEENE